MSVQQYDWDVVNDCIIEEQHLDSASYVTFTQMPVAYGGIINSETSGSTSYFHYDASGNVRIVTDDAGLESGSGSYDAWGNVVGDSGTFTQSNAWNGRFGYRLLDSANLANLVYVRARIYDTGVGLWTSADPFEEKLPDYIYCDNSPTTDTDPSGLCQCPNVGIVEDTCKQDNIGIWSAPVFATGPVVVCACTIGKWTVNGTVSAKAYTRKCSYCCDEGSNPMLDGFEGLNLKLSGNISAIVTAGTDGPWNVLSKSSLLKWLKRWVDVTASVQATAKGTVTLTGEGELQTTHCSNKEPKRWQICLTASNASLTITGDASARVAIVDRPLVEFRGMVEGNVTFSNFQYCLQFIDTKLQDNIRDTACLLRITKPSVGLNGDFSRI